MSEASNDFSGFLAAVEPAFQNFARQTHELMEAHGFKSRFEVKSSGYFLSYSEPKTRRSVLNLGFRKKGLFCRVYGDHIDGYESLLDSLPESMRRSMRKAPDCHRLAGSGECNPKCILGYGYTLDGELLQKCRYSAFMFEVSEETIPHLEAFLENEVRGRMT